MKITTNPLVQKYLNVNGKYSAYKSEERKSEIQAQKNKVIVQHYPVRTTMKNGESIFCINKLKF